MIFTDQLQRGTIAWTVEGKINEKNNARKQWDNHFEKNCAIVARKIAQNIVLKIFERLGETLPAPSKKYPTSTTPLTCRRDIDLAKTSLVTQFKDLAKETVELPPFNEWITLLENKQEVPEESSCSIFNTYPEELDTDYFQEKTNKLGQEIEKNINTMLSNYAASGRNSSFKYKVIWNPESLLNPNNYIEAQVWLNLNDSTDPGIQELRQKCQGKTWECYLY